MTIGNWITIGAIILVQGIAFFGYMMAETKRKANIAWRIEALERRAKKRDEEGEHYEKIDRKLSTLITVLREKKVVNGHPDLND